MGKKLSIEQVADEYGVSTRTIHRWIAAGILTAYRIGPHLLRLDAEQVEKELVREIHA